MSSSWFPAKHPAGTQTNGDSHPLLPSNGSASSFHDEDDDDAIELEMGRFATNEPKPSLLSRVQRLRMPLWVFLIPIVGIVWLLSPSKPRRPVTDYSTVSHAKVDRLLAKQSTTLDQATSRYRLRNQRDPPPGYEQWYSYAQKHSCLVDDYEQISRDFEPFYQLAQDDPKFFKKMVESGAASMKEHGRGFSTGVFEDHKFAFTNDEQTLYRGDWQRTFEQVGDFLPDMNVILNGRDEPRSLFNYRMPDVRAKALHLSDLTPFEHSPHPTSTFFKDEMHCIVPNNPNGFTEPANDASAFMLYASSTEFTTDLYPIMSMTKITPCFGDILVPSEFYYTYSGWAPRYAYESNITWSDKISKIYWRGMNSGGRMYGDNYHAFPRFRIIDIARKHRDIMDVKLSGFHGDLCGEKCDEEAIKKEYNIAHVSSPREEVYKYKYVFDVDGNSFSGRYLGLLRSGSLVFKSTVFLEYFGDWLKPFEHYIPVRPDLSDLVDKVEWAIEHDDEAHRIQQAGQVFAQRILTDAQNDCYFSLVLLEWGRLYGMAATNTTTPPPPPPEGIPGEPLPEAID
ncbi:glycosyl transferase family 90-domain-containing protein [Mycena amicta]|nr:glycosyl transferase family 90-domain-containing protein [Mycena amicta]